MKRQWYRTIDPVIEQLQKGMFITAAFDCEGRIGWAKIKDIYIQSNIIDELKKRVGKRWVRLDDANTHIGRFKVCFNLKCDGNPCYHIK
jgi:hypothetical protein